MPGGLIAHEVDDRRPGPARVVEIGERVGETCAQMQQRQRRAAAHARKAIGGTAADSFEQAQHGADLWRAVARNRKAVVGVGVGKTRGAQQRRAQHVDRAAAVAGGPGDVVAVC